MRTQGQFPHRVREVEHFTIALADGCWLAARMWRPVDAERTPVPAILEYLPYRKRDGTAARDEITHPYLAGHGYACVRVDLRGQGESEGLMTDEYTAQELADGCAVIDWIAAQPWCDGKVGMMGISWGGFNALQIAALRPPPLKAIVTICSTDDRYADDIHYIGGALLNDNLTWSSQMLAYSSRPPDPALLGDDWRRLWLARLEAMPLLAAEWLRHQRRDAYWRHGSVCEDFAAIEAAVLAVGGWADAYTNAVFRLLAGLRAPARGIVGPWLHKYPHLGRPAPAIGFLQEMLRWWDHWLKGRDTGVMGEPMLRAYLMESVRPAADYAARPGRWVAEPAWPSPNIETRIVPLTAAGTLPLDGGGQGGGGARSGRDSEAEDVGRSSPPPRPSPARGEGDHLASSAGNALTAAGTLPLDGGGQGGGGAPRTQGGEGATTDPSAPPPRPSPARGEGDHLASSAGNALTAAGTLPLDGGGQGGGGAPRTQGGEGATTEPSAPPPRPSPTWGEGDHLASSAGNALTAAGTLPLDGGGQGGGGARSGRDSEAEGVGRSSPPPRPSPARGEGEPRARGVQSDLGLTAAHPLPLDGGGQGGGGADPLGEQALTVASPPATGLAGGRFCPGMRLDHEFPTDQRTDDAFSLVFDGPPLAERLEILGAPVATLELAVDRPVAQIAVRLCDLHDDGAATRVTYGVLNLTHRESHARPSPLVPGRRYRVRLALNDIGYAFPPGHRLRLAVSTGYWPLVWPAPEPVRLSAFAGTLALPVRPPREAPEIVFAEPEGAPALAVDQLRPTRCRRSIVHDVGSGETVLETDDDEGMVRLRSHGLETGARVIERFTIGDDPLSARAEAAWTFTVGRGAWQTRSESRTVMTADAEAFYLEARIEAFEGDARIFEKAWKERIPRDLV